MIKRFRDEFVIFLLFIFIHLPFLGHDNFNTDVWKWKARSYDFGSGIFNLNFAQTLQKYHPGVTLMWLASFGVKIYNLYYDIVFKTFPPDNSLNTIFGLDFTQKIFVVTALSFTVCFIYYPVKKLFGRKYAFLSIFLFSTEPFYLALTRVIHLEGLMSTFIIASLVWIYYYMQIKSGISLVLSSFFASLAILTKTSSFFIVPFVFFYIFDSFKNSKQCLIDTFMTYFKWFIMLVLFFILFWPAMWVIPSQVVTTLYHGIFDIGLERGHSQFYFNKLTLDPGISYYFVVLLLKSSVILVLGIVAYLITFKKMVKTDLHKFSSFMLLFAGSYLIFLTIPSKKLDRYILPSVLSLTFLVGSFILNVIEYCKTYFAKYLILSTVIVFQLFFLVFLAPDYFSYYNPLFGGLNNGIYIIEPKWLIGKSQIIEYLKLLKSKNKYQSFDYNESIDNVIANDTYKEKLIVGFQEKYYTQIWPYVREIGAWAIIKDLTPYAIKADYLIYPVWDDESEKDINLNLKYIDTIKKDNVNIYRIYKVNIDDKTEIN